MDAALDKIGLYDFLGVFSSGMIIIIIMGYYTDLISINDFIFEIDDDFLRGAIFLLSSYFVGMVLQEATSFLDKEIPLFQFRKKACSNFLNNNCKNDVIDNQLELEEYQKLARNILNIKNKKHLFSEEECNKIYQFCKINLELHGSNGREDRIDALFAMSRTIFMSSGFMSFYYIYKNWTQLNYCTVLILFFLTIIFYIRARRFSEYRVRVIIRKYSLLSANSKEL